MARVAASAEEDGGIAAVEIGRAEIVLLHAVAQVAPDAAAAIALAALKLRQGVVHGRPVLLAVPAIGLAGLTVEIEQVLLAHTHVLGAVAVETGLHVADVDGLAGGGVDNHVVGTAHDGLGLAVLVPVVKNQVELLVRAGHEVGPHVNPPQTGAVHLVALMQVKLRLVAGLTQVAAIVTALDDELHLSVTVDIGHRAVVERIA